MAGKIADISVYQGEIDWAKARKALDGVIFRASVGSNPDKKYIENTAACGLPYGAYHYVKAGTPEQARTEARFFVECADRAAKRPLFYIADIEYEAQTETTTEAVCVAFLDELRQLGCGRIGMYINSKRKWAGAAIGMCDVMWIPHWGEDDGNVPPEKYAPQYPCDIWQYTSKGSVAGISGNVDLNILRNGRTMEWFTGETSSDADAPPSDRELNQALHPAQRAGQVSSEGEGKGDGEGKDGKGDGGMLTNVQLAAYCEKVYEDKWVYWYGTCGYKCSQSLYERKKAQYADQYGSARTSGYMADIKAGKMCADCVGMIKSFFWKGGEIAADNVYENYGCPDRSADGLFAMCSEKGAIGTIPDIPGLVVHKPGHIGVYVGGGYTVEMMGFAYDCVRRKVTEGPWTEWGRLPEIMLEYIDGATGAVLKHELGERTLRKGCSGADVKALQEALMSLGYPLNLYGADGDYGNETLQAVKNFQRDSGLEADGVFGTATFKVLTALMRGEDITAEPEAPDTPDGGSAPAWVLIVEGDEETLRKAQGEYGGRLAQLDAVKVVAEG